MSWAYCAPKSTTRTVSTGALIVGRLPMAPYGVTCTPFQKATRSAISAAASFGVG